MRIRIGYDTVFIFSKVRSPETDPRTCNPELPDPGGQLITWTLCGPKNYQNRK
jgi:hypothetical protein